MDKPGNCMLWLTGVVGTHSLSFHEASPKQNFGRGRPLSRANSIPKLSSEPLSALLICCAVKESVCEVGTGSWVSLEAAWCG